MTTMTTMTTTMTTMTTRTTKILKKTPQLSTKRRAFRNLRQVRAARIAFLPLQNDRRRCAVRADLFKEIDRIESEVNEAGACACVASVDGDDDRDDGTLVFVLQTPKSPLGLAKTTSKWAPTATSRCRLSKRSPMLARRWVRSSRAWRARRLVRRAALPTRSPPLRSARRRASPT